MDSSDTILNEIRRCNDDQLIAGLEQTLRKQRGATARLIAFMAEIDERRLYRDHAHTSMFGYAVDHLHMSEDEACVRIGAARTCRAYPVVLGMLARGELHLSGVRQLSSVMTPDNHLELLDLTRFKSRRAIERLLAERFPKPDVRNKMRKLPSRAPVATPARALSLSLEPALEHAKALEQPGSLSNPASSSALLHIATLPHPTSNPALIATAPALIPTTSLHAGSRTPAGSISPLRSDRYKIQFTASKQLHDKIEQAQHLLRHQIPNGDIGEICERALDLLLAQQMKERYGIGCKPRATKTATQNETPAPNETATQNETAAPSKTAAPKDRQLETRHIPYEVRRQVFVRDGGQCTFRSANGKRCQERGGLQFHHQEPYALGGKATLANIHLRCACHNLLDAELDFGRAFMRRRIDEAVAKRAENHPPRDGSSVRAAPDR